MSEIDLSKFKGTPISEMPNGATGYRSVSEEEFLNTLADDTDVKIIEADEFLSKFHVPGTYSLPRTLNTLEWWEVFNQGSIGSCLGSSDAQTATGVYWLKTGKVQEFSKFGHYLAIQLMADMKGCRPQSLGKDMGSIPTMALIVAAQWGYCPAELAPPYPRSYAEGLQSHRQYIEDLKNPNSDLRKAMAPFRMQKYIRITKAEQILKAKRVGAGFVQQSSIWPKTMDSHPTRIDDFSDSKDPNNRHAGGHAYQVLDITPNDEFVIGNTWDKGNAKGNTPSTNGGWGDEGAKTASMAAEQAIIDDKMSLVYLKTDMEHQASDSGVANRDVPIDMGRLT